jgi:hypothetical protein
MRFLKTFICLMLAAVILLSACSCGILSNVIRKKTVEVRALNPDLGSEVTAKEAQAPEGLDGDGRFESVGTWYDVGSEGYDGLPLSGDVMLTVSMPGRIDKKDIGGYVFVYYDEKTGECRYLFPDSYDLSAGTMSIDLPHFSLWGTAKLTREEQIEAFLDSYSTRIAVSRAKSKQAAADLEPYVRAKIEAMGLTKQATADLIQSTINFLGSRFTGDNAKYIETGTKYTTTVTRGYYEKDGEASVNGLEDAITDAVMNCWDALGYTDDLDNVLGENGFIGSTTEKLLSSTNGIARMAGYLASGTDAGLKEAMKELGNVMQGVHPAVELTTKAVACLGAKVHEEFTNWKANQIEELYQIYKNGAEDVWGNEVIPCNRESFLTYLNTSSGFTMAKGVSRFYNLDKVGEICEKYGWEYRTYEELPPRYLEIFQQRAENGLMEYFETRLQQEKTAEAIKASERKCIETMMSSGEGALYSGFYGKFFGEETPDDYNITRRLERLVNIRNFVSQYVDEDALAKVSKIDNSYNYGDILNWWVRLASENDRAVAIQKFREELREHNFLKSLGAKQAGNLTLDYTGHSGMSSLPKREFKLTAHYFRTENKGRDNEKRVDSSTVATYNMDPNYYPIVTGLFKNNKEIPVGEDGSFSYSKNGLTLSGSYDVITKTGTGTFSIEVTDSQVFQTEDKIKETVKRSNLQEIYPEMSRTTTVTVSGTLEIKPRNDEPGLLLVLNGSGKVVWTETLCSDIYELSYDDFPNSNPVINTVQYSGDESITFDNVTFRYLFG